MDTNTHTTTHGLAEPASTRTGAERAVREHEAREELRELYVGMSRGLSRGRLGSRQWRFHDAARSRAKRNPGADLLADASACAAEGASEAQVCGFFDRLAERARAIFRASATLPAVSALNVAETRAQGDADVAVCCYLAEPETSPRKRELLDAAIRALTAHRTDLARLEDRLREDRVLVFRPRPTRPQLVRG